VWKENILENLEERLLGYEIVGEFLADIRKQFGGGNEKRVKVAELKSLEQGEKIIKKFIQRFRKVVRGSRYKRRPLIEKFRRDMNRVIH